jgi:hypothetical protein
MVTIRHQLMLTYSSRAFRFVSNAQLVSMAESYFLNFLLLDVASVSWDISSDFLNQAFVNSEVLVHLKKFESPAGCMKPDHQALA